jgi:hypothetical protein
MLASDPQPCPKKAESSTRCTALRSSLVGINSNCPCSNYNYSLHLMLLCWLQQLLIIVPLNAESDVDK